MGVFPDLRPVRRFRNHEGIPAWDFELRRSRAAGVSALVRVRNEAAKIEACLGSILGCFDEVVVVDNASDDDTADRVASLGRHHRHGDRIRLFSYPHRLARFGPEHALVPADSVRSAVYFSNWALARCTRRAICKWDGDMVLLAAARVEFVAMLTRMGRGAFECWSLAGQTIYRDANGDYLEAVGEVNREVEVFPSGWGCRFEKRHHWERFARPSLLRRRDLAPVAFAELKYVGEDEFGHWSTTDWPSPRKRREWDNYQSVAAGAIDPTRFRRLPRTFLADQRP